MTEHSVLPLNAAPGMPPRDPLSMPVQDLRKKLRRPQVRASAAVQAARALTFGGAGLLTIWGSYEMTEVVAMGGVTVLEGMMTALFAVTFGWISLAATTALAGLVCPPHKHIRLARMGGKLSTRTALVMPIYHEDPAGTTAALKAMALGLHELGEAPAFEIVVLSDSTNAEAWVSETAAVEALRADLTGIMPVWYRRRWMNTRKKAGNIKEFVEKWGGRYPHFIVLDADSVMAPETLVTLAAAMEVDTRLGILQTVPTLVCGKTLFARLQQFAGKVHGPIVARGLAAWQGSDGNYWGHNAIIRTRAFAACCGLPDLPGKKPFGGPVLSHDFVEAALMRRGGWRVEMTPRLEGSWEESPPSLIDAATRDRRWAQGNLQHAKVITARGLAWPSRAHFAIGIMSYLASPLWLALIAFGFALSLQAHLILPEYFPEGLQLFPTWPSFDSERMVRLFVFTMGVLLLPKLLGLVRALALPELRRGCGGTARLLGSWLAELFVSALLAPIMMVVHSRQIYEILAGRDAGWSAQRRGGGRVTWAEAWGRHRWHMACGFAMAGAAWFLSPAILAWLSPTVSGLILAAPLSWASGSVRVGDWLRRAGLLVIPEESDPPRILGQKQSFMRPPVVGADDAILALATDERLRAAHFKWVSAAPQQRGAPDPTYLTAAEKVLDARSLEEALAWLEPRERVHVVGHQGIFERLLQLPRGSSPDTAAAGLPADTHRIEEHPPRMPGGELEPIRSPAA